MVNYMAIVVSAVVCIALGMFWYGPGFGKQWMRLVGMDKKKMEEMKQKGMTQNYILMIISTLVLVTVMGMIVRWSNAVGFADGLITGFWVWLGFSATMMLEPVLWEGKPWALYFINTSYRLVCFLLVGGILAAWV